MRTANPRNNAEISLNFARLPVATTSVILWVGGEFVKELIAETTGFSEKNRLRARPLRPRPHLAPPPPRRNRCGLPRVRHSLGQQAPLERDQILDARRGQGE